MAKTKTKNQNNDRLGDRAAKLLHRNKSVSRSTYKFIWKLQTNEIT